MADAGIRLVVEGEKEFKAALAACDAEVKNSQKSLKLLTEEYKLNDAGAKDLGAAQEILSTKSKVLADAIEVQSEKVRLLDARVEEASAAYGEHDKRTEALKAQLLDASTALAKLTTEQEKNNTAMLDAEHSTSAYDDAVAALTAAISANEAEMKVLDQSVNGLGEDYEGLGRSTEDMQKKTENLAAQNDKLREKADKLRDTIDKQKQITENLAKAQAETEKRYGAGSKEAEAYRKKIADTTSQIDRMEKELKETEKAIDSNAAAMEKGGDSPNKMIGGLEKIEELTGVKIPAGITQMIGGLDGGAVAVGGIVTALGTVAAKMAEIFKDTVQWSRDVTTQSQKLDLGTEEFQRLEYAASKAGFPLSDFEKALTQISNKALESDEVLGDWVGRMGDLKYASDDVKKAVADEMKYWDDLGVTLYDNEGNLKSTYDLMYDVIGALEKMTSDTEKNHAAQEIFGKKFKEVNTLVETGVETLKKYEKEAPVITEESVESLNEIGAAWDSLKYRVDIATKGLILDLTGLNKEAKTFGDWILNVLTGNLYGAVKAGSKWLGTTFGQANAYASGTDFAPGGLALVGERGPEIVELPRGSRVFPNGITPENGTTYATTYNISVDASNVRELSDLVRMAQGARVAMRRG